MLRQGTATPGAAPTGSPAYPRTLHRVPEGRELLFSDQARNLNRALARSRRLNNEVIEP